jgi:transcriptional regulator with XRE-family HTH domain
MEIAERIAAGDHPIRAMREWRDMTQMELSYRTNFGQGYISDLESGRRKGTVAALRTIAEALRVPLDLLISE